MSDKNRVSININKKLRFKIIGFIIFSFILVMYASNFYSTDRVEKNFSKEKFIDHLDERIPALMEDYNIPGVGIALVQEGETIWSNAYGYADVDEEREMTIDTYYRVESISKSVTSWGVMKLVQQGKIELDKPIIHYIKNWKFPETGFSKEKITIRQLLSHTSGMPLGDVFNRYSPKEKIPSLEESLSNEVRLIQEPGYSFNYSNIGYNLIELIIEEVTGRDFAEYMEEEVLIPLGMHKSSFTWSEDLEPGVPIGYDVKGQDIPLYIYPEKASGSLLASVDDIATFVTSGMTKFQKNHEVLTSHNIKKLYTPNVKKIGQYGLVFDSYGLGHYIETLSNGQQAVSHGGQGGGCMSHFHSVPDTGDGIVILTNSQRSWPFFAYILSDWSQWSGFASVGMGRIILGQKILWTIMGLIWFIFLWQVWSLGQGMISGKSHLAPLSKGTRNLCIAQSSLSIVLISALLWCINQDYLFISSVFPKASYWLGITILVYALVLLLSSFFPNVGIAKTRLK